MASLVPSLMYVRMYAQSSPKYGQNALMYAIHRIASPAKAVKQMYILRRAQRNKWCDAEEAHTVELG